MNFNTTLLFFLQLLIRFSFLLQFLTTVMDENYEKAKELCQKSKSWFFSADGILFKQAQLCLWYKKDMCKAKKMHPSLSTHRYAMFKKRQTAALL